MTVCPVHQTSRPGRGPDSNRRPSRKTCQQPVVRRGRYGGGCGDAPYSRPPVRWGAQQGHPARGPRKAFVVVVKRKPPEFRPLSGPDEETLRVREASNCIVARLSLCAVPCIAAARGTSRSRVISPGYPTGAFGPVAPPPLPSVPASGPEIDKHGTKSPRGRGHHPMGAGSRPSDGRRGAPKTRPQFLFSKRQGRGVVRPLFSLSSLSETLASQRGEDAHCPMFVRRGEVG